MRRGDWTHAKRAGVAVLLCLLAWSSSSCRTEQRGGHTPASPSPTASPPAQASTGERWTNPVDGAELLYVPAGPFIMGSNEGDPDEAPMYAETIGGFWIYRCEVTNRQFAKFVKETGYVTEPERDGSPDTWREHYPPGQGDYPVVNITWSDATAYCNWAAMWLPSEKQWEKAARGTDGRTWPWGNEWSTGMANTFESRFRSAAPVGSFPQGASPYGCLDMAGNVWEWCAEWYAPYPGNPDQKPPGVKGRARRGGYWFHKRDRARCANRGWYPPAEFSTQLGFRCVWESTVPLRQKNPWAFADQQ